MDKPTFVAGARFTCGHPNWHPCEHEVDREGLLTGRYRIRCNDCKDLLFDYDDQRPGLEDVTR